MPVRADAAYGNMGPYVFTGHGASKFGDSLQELNTGPFFLGCVPCHSAARDAHSLPSEDAAWSGSARVPGRADAIDRCISIHVLAEHCTAEFGYAGTKS